MQEDRVQQVAFPQKINRKLSLLFGLLFVLVLLVGGTSLYLARSIFLASQEVKRESERTDLVFGMYYTSHYLIELLERASLDMNTVAEGDRSAYMQQIRYLMRRYLDGGGAKKEMLEGMGPAIDDLDSTSKKIVEQMQQTGEFSAEAVRKNMLAVADVEMAIQTNAQWLSEVHKSRMEEMVAANAWKMQLILGFYAAFVLVGGFLILGFSFFFSRTIARPLRLLAQGASEVAQGNFQKQVPVQSKDEIGQLSHDFNIMVERLREHEEKLKGLATLEERERLAQELHDHLAQSIALLHLKLSEAESDFTSEESKKPPETLKDMRKIVDSAYGDVRQAIFGLRTMVSKELGFVPTLTEYLHEFSEMRKMPVDLKIHNPEAIRFSPQVEIQIIRIIHEALTNVFKHAHASKSTVQFERNGDFGILTVEDNGNGFVVEEGIEKRLHFGLQTMRERAEGVGGKLIIQSAPGKGTKVMVYVPILS
jgi:signal transduction histidine kinase